MATEEEADTSGGMGDISKLQTATARVLRESGAGKLSGSTSAGKGNTLDITYKAAHKVGAGVRNGTRLGERERVSGWQENPAGESSGAGGSEGVRKAS